MCTVCHQYFFYMKQSQEISSFYLQNNAQVLNRFLTAGFLILFSSVLYGQKAKSDKKYIQSQTKNSLSSIRYETKPAIGIIGNSTIARYAGGESIAALMNETSAYSITDISVPGYTIHQEDSLWRAIPIGVKQSLNYVFVEIGNNDLKPEEPASKALARYQSLINLIRSETNKSCKIITSTMTPLKQRLINLFGNTEGLIAYKKMA